MFDGPGGSTAFPRTFIYGCTGTVAISDVVAQGYFAACGSGSRSPSSVQTANVGMRVGDIVIVRQSTDASTAGFTVIRSVIASTADQASTVAATGWNAAYNVTISGT